MTGCDGHEARAKSCIPAMLRERARLRPDDMAFTFVDYEQDSDGVTESLTWDQLYRRALSVAQALSVRGSTGDRALILTPGFTHIGVVAVGDMADPKAASFPAKGLYIVDFGSCQ